MKQVLIFLTLLLCTVSGISGQDGFILRQDSLQSEILKQNRKLDIFLPEGYDTGDARYPVIYVLGCSRKGSAYSPDCQVPFSEQKNAPDHYCGC